MKNQNTLYDIRLTNEEREFLIAAGGNRARKILSRATKINPTLLENKEILTEKKMNELFGKNKYVLYYNFDANKWNTGYFMGYARADIEKDTSEIKKMKTILEKRLSFINTEIVAVVIASDMKYPGWGNTTNIKAEPKNTAVGALICRNKKTGKILPQIKRRVYGKNKDVSCKK